MPEKPTSRESINSIKSMDGPYPWKLKKQVMVKGGGTLKISTKEDDEESYLYQLKTPTGRTVILLRYCGKCTLESFDPNNNKSRLISFQK